ncbi:hypothetical protein KR200_001970 [Drosophila serrata]|nr:hypothetical protein KR200_001970 [Drosophila serrata]
MSISLYWNRLFHRQKSQPTDEAPEQETIARSEEEDIKVLKLQQEHNNSETETQSEPECLRPETPINSDQLPVANEAEVYWKRWFHRTKSQPKDQAHEQKTIAGNEMEEVRVPKLQLVQDDPESQSASDFELPPQGASEEQPIEADQERVEHKTPIESDYISVTAQSEDAGPNHSASGEVNLPMDPEPERLKPEIPKKKFYRNVSEKDILSTFEPDHLFSIATDPKDVEPCQPSSNAAEQEEAKVYLTMDPEAEGLKPKTPMIKLARHVSEEHISITAEPEDAEPNQPSLDGINLVIDPEPQLLKPKPPTKRFPSNVSEKQILRSFQRDNLSIATEPENVEPNKVSSHVAEAEDLEPNNPASDEVSLAIDHEPDRLKPKTPKKKVSRNMSEEEHILSTFEPKDLPIATEQEIVEPNKPSSHASEPEDAVPNRPTSDEINPNP